MLSPRDVVNMVCSACDAAERREDPCWRAGSRCSLAVVCSIGWAGRNGLLCMTRYYSKASCKFTARGRIEESRSG